MSQNTIPHQRHKIDERTFRERQAAQTTRTNRTVSRATDHR